LATRTVIPGVMSEQTIRICQMEIMWQLGEQREERDRTSEKFVLPIWRVQGREKDAGS
jgi:hypothetical protein